MLLVSADISAATDDISALFPADAVLLSVPCETANTLVCCSVPLSFEQAVIIRQVAINIDSNVVFFILISPCAQLRRCLEISRILLQFG